MLNWWRRWRWLLFVVVIVGVVLYALGPLVGFLTLAVAFTVGMADQAPGLPVFFWRYWPYIALLTAVGVVTILPGVTDRTGSDSFYEVAAQVIPVLLLAIALQARLVQRDRQFELRLAILSVGVLALGEFYALRSIEEGHGGPDEFSWVVGALTYGFLAIGLNALSLPPPDDETDGGESDHGDGS